MSESASATDLEGEETRLEAIAPGYLGRVRAAAGRLSQRSSAASDAEAALGAVDELARIDVDVPVASRYPAVRPLKGAVKKLVGWYLRYLGAQITAFGQAVAHLGNLIVQRTEDLEARTGRLEADLERVAARVERLEQDRSAR